MAMSSSPEHMKPSPVNPVLHSHLYPNELLVIGDISIQRPYRESHMFATLHSLKSVHGVC